MWRPPCTRQRRFRPLRVGAGLLCTRCSSGTQSQNASVAIGIHGHIDAETLAACFDHDTDVDAILAIKGSDGQIVSSQWMVIHDGYWHDEQQLDVDTRTTRELVEKLKK